jgi:hypothetical protein
LYIQAYDEIKKKEITPWQSALKFTLLTIFFVAIRGLNTIVRGTHLSAVCRNRVNSSTSNFISTVPLTLGF